MPIIETFAAIFILAVLVEGFIEYFVSDPNKKQPWLKYLAAVFGMALCVAYDADLFAALGLHSAYPFIGEVLTGLVIGRGSNYLNQFIGQVSGKGQATVSLPRGSNASAEVRVAESTKPEGEVA